MKIYLLFFLLIGSFAASAQVNDSIQQSIGITSDPIFCEDLNSFFQSKIKYPEDARRLKTEGTVYVTIYIDSIGKIYHTRISKGVSDALDNEALRVTNMLKVCRPKLQNGHPIKSVYKIPVQFQLK